MKKLSLFILMGLLIFTFLGAASVSEELAMSVGQKWLSHVFPEKTTIEFSQNQTAKMEGQTLYYILSIRGGGWVLVAADDRSMPILGYSDTGVFDYPISCPAVVYWMSIYEKQIAEAINRDLPNNETKPGWNELSANQFSRWDFTRDVGALLSTTWNQGQYYNESCPSDISGPGSHAWAGCTATAMGQVMKYWSHPSQGTSSNSYTDGSTFPPAYGAISADFGATSYNWSSMPNSISACNTAVATLLFQCGVAVDMDYGVSAGSGALVYTNDAMETFFAYDPAAQWLMRSSYSDATWKSMMRADLDLYRPIIYNGYDSSLLSGHCFVMDGYRTSQSDFHFNFGWGGFYDGYFSIDSLVPQTGYDFRYGQWAYYNIYPGVTVSGTIKDASNNPLSNVTVTFSNGGGVATTNSAGFYSITMTQGYTGTATPSLSAYSFNPSSRTYTNITSLQTSQNYTASQALPPAPSNLNATSTAYDRVQLYWTDNSSNETGFLIDCKLLTDLNWQYRTTVNAGVTSYLDSGLMPAQTYIYRVMAFNGAGNSIYVYSQPVTTLAPPPPGGLFASSVNFTDAFVNWTELGSATVWDIEYGSSGFTIGTGSQLPMISQIPFQLMPLQQGTSYDWYVRSSYPFLNLSSAWAGPGNFTTQGTPTITVPGPESVVGGDIPPELLGQDSGIPAVIYTVTASGINDVTVVNPGWGVDWYCWIKVGTTLFGGGNPIPAATMSYNFPNIDFDAKGNAVVIINDNQTLPVELSSFTATINANNYIQLNWITQTETGVLGYLIYRDAIDNIETAQLVSNMITATNTSQQQAYVFIDTDIYEEGIYYYWLQNVDLDGSNSFHGPVMVQFSIVDSGGETPGIPLSTQLKTAFPNPFNPCTRIPYDLAKSAEVKINIYNSRGQLVKGFPVGSKDSGSYYIDWDGRTEHGVECPTGVYFINMQAGSKHFVSKAVLVK